MEIILCKFRKTHGNYNAGEVAGFSQGAAEELFAHSLVNFVKMDPKTKEVSIVKASEGQKADDARAEERRERQEAVKAKVDEQVAERLERPAEPKPLRMQSPDDDPTMSPKDAKQAIKDIARRAREQSKK